MQQTMHGRTGACVDYYATVTGAARVESMDDPRQPGGSLRVLRVERLVELITCRECWLDPIVQAQLRESRRSGALPEA